MIILFLLSFTPFLHLMAAPLFTKHLAHQNTTSSIFHPSHLSTTLPHLLIHLLPNYRLSNQISTPPLKAFLQIKPCPTSPTTLPPLPTLPPHDSGRREQREERVVKHVPLPPNPVPLLRETRCYCVEGMQWRWGGSAGRAKWIE